MLSLICASLLLSCKTKTDNGPMVIESRDIDYKDLTADVIPATPLMEIPGVLHVVVHDSLLIFVTSDPEGMVKVYNKRTLQPIASFCTQGRAANEFQGMIYNYNVQKYQRNGDLILPLEDIGSSMERELNVSASLREGHTVIEGSAQRGMYTQHILLDNNLDRTFTLFEPVEDLLRAPGIMPMPVYAVTQNGQIVKEIPVFKEHLKSESTRHLNYMYGGQMLKHPDRNLVVMPMSSMDYILFFDLDHDRTYAVHQKGSPTAAEIYLYNDRDKNPKGGMGGPIHIPGTDMFMCCCASGKYTEQTLKEDRMGLELMFFDYDGNYKGGVKLDHNIMGYAYDPETKTLYTLDPVTEQVKTVPLGSDPIGTIFEK